MLTITLRAKWKKEQKTTAVFLLLFNHRMCDGYFRFHDLVVEINAILQYLFT
jgi:hypothetical protein